MSSRSEVLKLYRAILKLHKKKLPAELRKLGDDYVRNEWKLHKEVAPSVAKEFIGSWKEYFQLLKSQKEVKGADLKEEQISGLGPEQLKQLENLKNESQKAFS